MSAWDIRVRLNVPGKGALERLYQNRDKTIIGPWTLDEDEHWSFSEEQRELVKFIHWVVEDLAGTIVSFEERPQEVILSITPIKKPA